MLRKDWVFLIICLVTLYACKQKKHISHEDIWIEYRKAYTLLQQHNDSAFYYFNQAAAHSRDSTIIAMAYCNMGIIQSVAGDYYGAQESLLTSLKFLDEKNKKDYDLLARDYNELGISASDLENYDQAIQFYDKSLEFTNEKQLITSIYNNKANAYQKEYNYDRALKIYSKVISQVADKKDYARMLTNMAIAKWLYHPDYNAVPELMKSLYIRKKENDLSGEGSSYNFLADFYSHSHPDSALFYANKRYEVARQLNSSLDEMEALQLLIKLGPEKEARDHFERYQKLNDSLQTARNASKNQFALIRYEVEKQKSDNLKLQKDNSEAKYELIKQRVLLYGVLFMLIGGSVIAVLWYRKRKERLELEFRSTIRESEIKTSKKVHDVVANGLYRMMSEIENEDEVDKLFLLDRIEVLYERSRDISYEAPQTGFSNFPERIAKLILSFATAGRKIVLVGNETDFWTNTSSQVKVELEYILQELMVNMGKHSRAKNVVIKFEQQADLLHIDYTDDGVGFKGSVKPKNGLTSTGNRIKAINGEITFEGTIDKGLKIRICIPIT